MVGLEGDVFGAFGGTVRRSRDSNRRPSAQARPARHLGPGAEQPRQGGGCCHCGICASKKSATW